MFTGKSINGHTVGTHLPKLCEEDSHDFGHADVDVNRERSLWSVEIINIIDL